MKVSNRVSEQSTYYKTNIYYKMKLTFWIKLMTQVVIESRSQTGLILTEWFPKRSLSHNVQVSLLTVFRGLVSAGMIFRGLSLLAVVLGVLSLLTVKPSYISSVMTRWDHRSCCSETQPRGWQRRSIRVKSVLKMYSIVSRWIFL